MDVQMLKADADSHVVLREFVSKRGRVDISTRLSILEDKFLLRGEEKEREEVRFMMSKGDGCSIIVFTEGVGVQQLIVCGILFLLILEVYTISF